MRRFLLPAAAFVLAGSAVVAQSPPTPAPVPAPQKPEPVEAAQTPPYTYDPGNRRDPFLSLIGRGNDPRTASARPAGVSGLLIGEVTVKGTLRDRSGFIALILAPDNRTYMVRVGDKLLDGSVKSIGQDKVIFSQDVNDPLSLVKQREVPKAVRPPDGRGVPPEA